MMRGKTRFRLLSIVLQTASIKKVINVHVGDKISLNNNRQFVGILSLRKGIVSA